MYNGELKSLYSVRLAVLDGYPEDDDLHTLTHPFSHPDLFWPVNQSRHTHPQDRCNTYTREKERMTDTRYRDGATVRRTRLLDIIDQIEQRKGTKNPPTLEYLQSVMTIRHGLTRFTTQKYLRELELAGIIRVDSFGIYWTRMSVVQILGNLVAPDSTGVLPGKLED